MTEANWHRIGKTAELRKNHLQTVEVERTKVALSFHDGQFGAVANACNHVGGPLGGGTLDGEYLVCPWHYWKFHRTTGEGEPGFEEDRVPSYELEERGDELWINLTPKSRRQKKPHDPHPLARTVQREPGPIRVAGISTTVMDEDHPRYSTSEALLDAALTHARADLGLDTRLIRLSALQFRACEGFYSKSAHACTWPCSITAMDSGDQLDRVYEALVHWADVVLVATPIRWGAASSLYYKMVERMNCIQNQLTTHNRVLIQNKVAGFIITGGQDNVQAVAGQMMGFFAELGFVMPPFPYIAHSLGWTAENMERNVAYVQNSRSLPEGARELLDRSIETAKALIDGKALQTTRMERAGRKAHGS